jgi:hypothetical protein
MHHDLHFTLQAHAITRAAQYCRDYQQRLRDAHGCVHLARDAISDTRTLTTHAQFRAHQHRRPERPILSTRPPPRLVRMFTGYQGFFTRADAAARYHDHRHSMPRAERGARMPAPYNCLRRCPRTICNRRRYAESTHLSRWRLPARPGPEGVRIRHYVTMKY